MRGIRIGTHKSKDLTCHFTTALNPHEAGEYVASLKPSDFEGYDPINGSNADKKWVGRPDIEGQVTRKQIAATLGDYVENDHKQITSAKSQMSDLVDSIDLTQIKRQIRWNDSKGRVAPLRLLNGESHYRRQIRRSKAPVEAVALVVPTGANCNISAEIIFAKTAVALAAAELLGEAGFAVEVWAYAFSENCLDTEKNGSRNTLAAMRIKAADEPLNEAIAASGGSAWFFRSGFFGMWAAHGDASCGLGYSRGMSKKEGAEIANCLGLEKAHMMRASGDCRSVEDAIKTGIEDVKQAIMAWTDGGDIEGDE